MNETSTIRLILGLLLALCIWLFAPSAFADTRVVVRAFPGPGGADARGAVVRVLLKRDGVVLVPNDQVDEAASARGVGADTPTGRREVGKDLNVAIWIEGSVRRQAGELTLTVVGRGASNEELARFSTTRRKVKQLSSAIGTRIWEVLGPAIESRSSPDAQAGPAQPGWNTEPVSPAFDPERSAYLVTPLAPRRINDDADAPRPARIDGESTSPHPKAKRTGLEFALTLNALHRTLSYSDAFSAGLANYTLAVAPLGDVAARLFPFAFSRRDWLSCIGLDMRGQMAFALTSEGQAKVRYPTTYDSFGVGLAGRIPIGEHELNAVVGYSAQRFSVGDVGGQPAPVPSVDYRALRAALGTRVLATQRLLLGLELAWLQISETGELGSRNWFPRPRGIAFDGMLYADVKLVGPLKLRVRVAFQRADFKFKSQEGDRRIAGGATDDYLTGGLGLSLAF